MKEQEHGGNILAAARKYGRDPDAFLDFSTNTNPLGPPPGVEEVYFRSFPLVGRYPDPEETRRLKAQYASFFGVSPENIVFANGATELIYLVFQAVRPRRVLIPGPTFREYDRAARAFGARRVHLRLSPLRGFVPGREALRRAAAGVDLAFICNPNNPTGNLVPREVVEDLAAACRRTGAFLVSDESFLPFHPAWRELSLIPEACRRRNVLVLVSLTKIFAIPGLRLGCGLAHPETAALLEELQPPWSVNSIARAVARELLRDPGYLEATWRLVAAERAYLEEGLRRLPGAAPFPSAANFLLVRLTGKTAAEVEEGLGKRGILIRNCSNFAFLDARYIRVAVRRRPENEFLLAELSEVLQEEE